MKTIVTFAMLAASVSGSVVLRANNPTPTATGIQKPSSFPITGQIKSQGCYSSLGADLKLIDGVKYPTIGGCAQDTCLAQGFKVSASSAGVQCFCGNKLPPASSLVDDALCNTPCSGWDEEACGNVNGTIFSVYSTGKSGTLEHSPEESPSPSSTPPPTKDTTGPTAPPATVTKTTPEANTGGGGGSNTAGIAAGVVIGVLAIAGIVGGILFYMRRKRNREIEEEHRRNAAVNSFMNGGKPPGSSGGLSSSDSRIDPVMAQRRSSTGSIADNEDYSRKILRVTNA